ncbi:MBL fold metallo-hydrolase [Achromobacter denitrificans]|jgi:glyoxylase-like metal-dependent hydrolase (beta-lactamase superfamily II)|uniref:MBL fold metallo-hydrolase n=1 Tax=Achromobacter denitrificans TaxID=32002 RepID=UPI000B4C81DE|nr:MBL fold metallo-hydrolase [Achromobacter denitrificans]ASC64951.1 MBL fold metallo-hydrolase [Achromobacter denitrificans]MDF3850702.1 MBL fold metallo-hydrolase [Achromobacter denitrificans]MDF3860553.1 MBL fold metallo-hydrolase [Achromobacter denitrificans]QCS63324.1 MBL fold metallo-hydrolase [Achromobacter denitrificans]CAB3828469.1 putative metallo-hydrolase [Achromobacter denitrificans]
MPPQIQGFFDPVTATITYVVHEAAPGGACAIIDSVLDYDPKSGRSSTASADRVADYVRQHGLKTEWLLETHAHADHLSAAPYLQRQLGGVIAIGQSIQTVQGVFKKIFNLEPEFQLDGSQFGHLFADGETFRIGELTAQAIHVPGHTPADMAYLIGDAAFVGDTLFMPDVGTARCDFPGGDAHQLYRSIQRLLSLPAGTRLYMCHDYPPSGRDASWQTTVAEQRRANIHVREGIGEDDFVAMRTRRDATLSMPTLILPAIQVNIRAGHFPPAEDNGVRYLKIPVDAL